MNQESIIKQGEAFYEAHLSHQQIDTPCTFCPDLTKEEAYAIQSVYVKALTEKQGYHISGKKVGLTSKAMQKLSNISEPDYGYMFHELGFFNGSSIPADKFIEPRVECEIAFKLCKDLNKGKVSVEEVLDATEYVIAAMEICDFRMFREKTQRTVMDSIADNAAFGGYVLGDVPVDPHKLDLAMIPFIFEFNNRQAEVSCGAAVYDHPAKSVAWLAETFYRVGDPLRAGELILSGSAVASLPVSAGDSLRCRMGQLGEVSCRFV